MRISDWSSDVCSPDLVKVVHGRDLRLSVAFPFYVTPGPHLACVNDQATVSEHIHVSQKIGGIAGAFAAVPIADECAAIRFRNRAQLRPRLPPVPGCAVPVVLLAEIGRASCRERGCRDV